MLQSDAKIFYFGSQNIILGHSGQGYQWWKFWSFWPWLPLLATLTMN